MKLYVNGEQKALAAVDIKAESYADYQLHYTITDDGVQCGVVRIEDAPITFSPTYWCAVATDRWARTSSRSCRCFAM